MLISSFFIEKRNKKRGNRLAVGEHKNTIWIFISTLYLYTKQEQQQPARNIKAAYELRTRESSPSDEWKTSTSTEIVSKMNLIWVISCTHAMVAMGERFTILPLTGTTDEMRVYVCDISSINFHSLPFVTFSLTLSLSLARQWFNSA